MIEHLIDLPDLPAGVYRHYKGHLYLVLGYAQDSTNDSDHEVYVVYVGLTTEGSASPLRTRLRKVPEFFSHVKVGEDLVARFRYIGPRAW